MFDELMSLRLRAFRLVESPHANGEIAPVCREGTVGGEILAIEAGAAASTEEAPLKQPPRVLLLIALLS